MVVVSCFCVRSKQRLRRKAMPSAKTYPWVYCVPYLSVNFKAPCAYTKLTCQVFHFTSSTPSSNPPKWIGRMLLAPAGDRHAARKSLIFADRFGHALGNPIGNPGRRDEVVMVADKLPGHSRATLQDPCVPTVVPARCGSDMRLVLSYPLSQASHRHRLLARHWSTGNFPPLCTTGPEGFVCPAPATLGLRQISIDVPPHRPYELPVAQASCLDSCPFPPVSNIPSQPIARLKF